MKCEVEGCNEPATKYVTEIVEGKIFTARACERHCADIARFGTEQNYGRLKPDLASISKMALLLVPPLCEGMADDSAGVRLQCVCMLRFFGAAASPALPTLRNLINDPDEDVRKRASRAIELIDGAMRAAEAPGQQEA
jgi:hypothetical protein